MATERETSRFRDLTGATEEQIAEDCEQVQRRREDEPAEEREAAVSQILHFWESVLQETGGRGVSPQALDEAIQAARSH